MNSQGWILIPFGLVFTLIGVGNLAIDRLHPETPNAFLSRGLGYVGIVVGLLSFVFGLLTATGVVDRAADPPAAGARRDGGGYEPHPDADPGALNSLPLAESGP